LPVYPRAARFVGTHVSNYVPHICSVPLRALHNLTTASRSRWCVRRKMDPPGDPLELEYATNHSLS